MPNAPKTFKPPVCAGTPFIPPVPEGQERVKTAAQGYGARWQKIAKGFLKSHPLCAICMKTNIVTAATQVDHITPHKGDMKIFFTYKNWQSLCASCHSRKTRLENRTVISTQAFEHGIQMAKDNLKRIAETKSEGRE